ncbi:MAG: methyltransferase domain-containing protein [Deltaproteobacteria bacterium]|nr:methyltransferase domain-containing protein [Deltaproteobacteria bacterium]
MKEDSDRRIVEKILQHDSLENRRVLEVGCGDGRITALLAGKPKELIAIDPDENKVNEAQEKVTGVDFQVGSGEDLKFSDKFFDVVIFTLSLHHQDSRGAIGEARRVLKDDGVILVIEPIEEGEVEQLFALFNDEKEVKLQAQKAINESGLIIKRSEIFNAEWTFENKEELCLDLFGYYEMPYDDNTAAQVFKLLGEKVENSPIILTDTMIVQSLKKI